MPLARLPEPFDHPDWIFELKYDGWRALAYIEAGTCRLVSRNGNAFKRFPDHTLAVLRGFKDEGLRLAIDDFGTGYSSLSRLRYMPVDVLKIDRTFIREVHSDPQSASMVSAIIALASNLEMLPLAEGIETEDEWRFLADRAGPCGQGFLFSKPVPAEQITAMHRRAGLHVVEGGLAM